MRTEEGYCLLDNGIKYFPDSLSGTMCEHSMEPNGEGALMLSPEDSPVKSSRLRVGVAQQRKTFGLKCEGLLLKLSREEYSLKTCSKNQFKRPLKISKPKVMWFDVVEHPPPAWVPHTADLGIGYLPTLTTRNNQMSKSMRKWPAYRRLHTLLGRKRPPIAFWEWMMGWCVGWTSLQPLEMAKFQGWLRSWVDCLKGTWVQSLQKREKENEE
jgi:hypothetical protein